MQAMPLRFEDVRLGEAVSFDGAFAGDGPLAQRVCDMVRRWSGTPSASLVSAHGLDDGFAPERLAGRVMARHLDGTNNADVEIILQARNASARAVVRVALG
ncbi:hypothetical protein [Novosphingobium sp. EMRT-2]|uniref:hypothetical protein n=1 Tax=Novosphingobium sp. EMRT-2 TaxID=2571749 RepID=UPI00143D20ED|nr:hypothetical protein [Novosphingobium sp. EMRT-2]